jgi:threonine synthase
MRELFQGASVSEADTAKTILSTLNETGEVIDPHTAVGVAAANVLRLADPATPVVVLSTAHPAKFPEAVRPPPASPRPPRAPRRTCRRSPRSSTACRPTPRR